MLLSPQDARRFMTTYERVAIALHAVCDKKPPKSPSACLAAARKRLQQTPALLDQAVRFLEQRDTESDSEVITALRQMQLAEWVHLKDLKSGAIFLNQEGTEAYSAVGLTQLPSAIIGDRGFLVETALCPFAGKILCDGIFVASVQLGQGIWRSFHTRYLNLKAAGRLHRKPATAPPWRRAAAQSAAPLKDPPAMEVLEPWQMVPLDVVDDALAYLEAKLQPHHPLREHALFPLLKREDSQIWIVTKYDDDGTTWLLDLTSKRRFQGRTIYAFRQLTGDELDLIIQKDHQQWLGKFDDETDAR
jgi:hypothetical protein